VENVAEFNDIIVKNVGGSPIRLRDLGYVEDGMAEKRTFAQRLYFAIADVFGAAFK